MEMETDAKFTKSLSQKVFFDFDNMMGYRYGSLVWMSFWIPSFITLLCDSAVGASRDFLYVTSLFSCLSFMYFSYHRWVDSPASTPALHCLTTEMFARWLALAYYGFNNVVGSDALGVMNWVQFVGMCVFTATKLPGFIYSVHFPEKYKEYETNAKKHIV